MAVKDKSPKTSLAVKDLILDRDEFCRLKNGRKTNKKKESTYTVILQNKCDFAIERRDTGRHSVSRLVVLVSRFQCYVEDSAGRKVPDRDSLKSFFSGLGKGDVILLPEVNWIKRLENRANCREIILEVSSGDKTDGSVSGMIRQGLFFFDGSRDLYDVPLRKCVVTYSDEELQLSMFKHYEVLRPSMYRHYEELQRYMYKQSAALYKYMLEIMAGHRGITIEELLRDVIPDRETKESMLFRSFVSFLMIGEAFGNEKARSAMHAYIDSNMKDVLPAGRLNDLLCDDDPVGGCLEIEFDADRFIDYMFRSSVAQGYTHNMELFLYQWRQALFLQKELKVKTVDKYPEYLASLNVQLMSMVPDVRNGFST